MKPVHKYKVWWKTTQGCAEGNGEETWGPACLYAVPLPEESKMKMKIKWLNARYHC